MSSIAEMAREEAERVEAEEAAAAELAAREAVDVASAEAETGTGEPSEETETETGEPEPEPEPSAASGPTDADLQAIDKAHKAHEKALRKVMGDAFDQFTPCPACFEMGFIPLGQQAPPEPVHDPQTQTCPGCNGLGVRLTGSFAIAQESHSCTDCQGKGWVAKIEPAPAPVDPAAAAAGAQVGQPVAAEPVAPEGYILVKTAP